MWDRPEYEILDMIGDNSLKTQDICNWLVRFDSNWLTLQANHKKRAALFTELEGGHENR